MTVVVLGPQGPQPTLRQAVDALGLAGPLALVTAGWQEYESDDAELRAELGGRAKNLELHRRAEEVFESDPELASAYRARQERLRELQQSYRVRLEHAAQAARQVARLTVDPALAAEEREVSLAALRALDAEHLARCQRVRADFDARVGPDARRALVQKRREIADLLSDCAALVIAGGHVAVLLNRLRLFDLAALVGGRPLVAWSAGAMALAERVVLFHDDPPQGEGIAEVLDHGLGLAPGLIALPHAHARLRLSDRERVACFARRFAPAACVTLDPGARAQFDGARWSAARGTLRLSESGDVDPSWPP